jgi:hypothetical protein
MSSVIDPLIDPARVARLLGVEVETLGVWRRRDYGPRWFRIGKKIKYSPADVQAWLAAQGDGGGTVGLPYGDRRPVTTGEQLTATLAKLVMGWGVSPDRFLKGDRRWAPRWHFQPLRRLEHALQLLKKAEARYTFTKAADGTFTAHVSVGDRAGSASGKSDAAAITVALAHALGIEVEDCQ